MPRTHSPYATEYRRLLVELARAGRSVSELGARAFQNSRFSFFPFRNLVRPNDLRRP
jgi:hypothetical protein